MVERSSPLKKWPRNLVASVKKAKRKNRLSEMHDIRQEILKTGLQVKPRIENVESMKDEITDQVGILFASSSGRLCR